MPKGARNPKTVRLSVSVDDTIDARINRLADTTGMNKGTMAAVVIAAGLTALEAVMLPTTAERQAEIAMQLAKKVQGDVKQEAEHQDKRDMGFKPRSEADELELVPWVPVQGYMAGL